MTTVLLSDAHLRKTLSAARSLGGKGITVIAASNTRWNPTAFSKYCSVFLVCPDPAKSPERYLSWLVDTLRTYKCDVFFPMDDITMDIAIANRIELEKLCKLPIPSSEYYNVTRDKAKTANLAKESGVAAPNTWVLNDLKQLDELKHTLSYPIVIKPRMSSGSRGIRVVSEKNLLIAEYMKIHKIYPFPLLQEYIGTGDRYDVCLLFNEAHELKASFVQKEIRHFPNKIGPSTVQESVYNPDLISTSMKIMENLQWHGIIELEYMIDQNDGNPKLMEINPRFWNSLHLSTISGIDFPWLLYQVSMNHEIQEHFEYRFNIFCRNLLPGDFLHFLFNHDRKHMDPPFISKKNFLFDDIISKDDVFPIVGFVFSCIRYIPSITMLKNIFFR